jgi:hypothetical protein
LPTVQSPSPKEVFGPAATVVVGAGALRVVGVAARGAVVAGGAGAVVGALEVFELFVPTFTPMMMARSATMITMTWFRRTLYHGCFGDAVALEGVDGSGVGVVVSLMACCSSVKRVCA